MASKAKGIRTVPTRGQRCPSVDWGERGNKVRNHVATRVVSIMATTEPIKTFHNMSRVTIHTTGNRREIILKNRKHVG